MSILPHPTTRYVAPGATGTLMLKLTLPFTIACVLLMDSISPTRAQENAAELYKKNPNYDLQTGLF